MKEEYVNLETAKLLKELGFDWDCEKNYSLKDGIEYGTSANWNALGLLSIPTLSLAQKWVYEKFGLWVSSSPSGRTMDGNDYFLYTINSRWDNMILRDNDHEKSHKDSLSFGLVKALQIIKERQS